jgi:hypothetical protein
MMRDCECCGAPSYPECADCLSLCDGCNREGECDPGDTWHCDGRYGHQCDGTGCEAYRSEQDAEMVAWLSDAIKRNLNGP